MGTTRFVCVALLFLVVLNPAAGSQEDAVEDSWEETSRPSQVDADGPRSEDDADDNDEWSENSVVQLQDLAQGTPAPGPPTPPPGWLLSPHVK